MTCTTVELRRQKEESEQKLRRDLAEAQVSLRTPRGTPAGARRAFEQGFYHTEARTNVVANSQPEVSKHRSPADTEYYEALEVDAFAFEST
jgi:hypothetical protein